MSRQSRTRHPAPALASGPPTTQTSGGRSRTLPAQANRQQANSARVVVPPANTQNAFTLTTHQSDRRAEDNTEGQHRSRQQQAHAHTALFSDIQFPARAL
jgi:hypothetical protein